MLKKCLLMTLLIGTLISGSAYAEEGTNQVVKHKGTLEFFYFPSDIEALNREKDILQKWESHHTEISIDEIDLTQNFSDALKKGFLHCLTNQQIAPLSNPYSVDPIVDHYGNPGQDRAINALPAVERAMNAANNAEPAVYAVGRALYNDDSMFFLLKDSDGNYLAQDRGNISESNLDNLIERAFLTPSTESDSDNLIERINRSFPTPYLDEVNGYHNQMATNTDTFNISLVYGNADVYRYKLDNGNWSEWKTLEDYNQTGYLTISGITEIGPHKIIVEIKNSTNALTSRGYMYILKL